MVAGDLASGRDQLWAGHEFGAATAAIPADSARQPGKGAGKQADKPMMMLAYSAHHSLDPMD